MPKIRFSRCSDVWGCPKHSIFKRRALPWVFFFTLFERNISNGRAGVVQTNQNLFQNPAKAAFLSSNLKCAGLVLGSAHQLMSPSFMSPRLLVSTLVQTETVPKDLKAGPHQRKVPGQLLCMQITLLRSPASP